MKLYNNFSSLLASLLSFFLLQGLANADTHYFNDSSFNGNWVETSTPKCNWSCDSYSSAVTYSDAKWLGEQFCSPGLKIWSYSTIFGTTNYHYACCTGDYNC